MRKITTHISPYLGGLAPETHQFVEYLNREIAEYVSREGLWIKGAVTLRGVTGEYEPPVRFVATANRIWAIGNLKLAAYFPTLGGELLRNAFSAGYVDHERRPVWAHRPIDRQTDAEIEGEKPVLKPGNSQHRGKLRKLEKNRRFGAAALDPWRDHWRERGLAIHKWKNQQVLCRYKDGARYPLPRSELANIAGLVRLARAGETPLLPREVLRDKVKVAAGTLYQFIDAIPQAERDSEEIYPGDFLKARIPAPQRTNWDAKKLEHWIALGWNVIGTGEPESHGLRDYSQTDELLLKSGQYETVDRQKAASVVRHIAITTARAIFYLWLLRKLTPPAAQRLLERAGRLYRVACDIPSWPSEPEQCLFDKCEHSSYAAASWTRHRVQGLEGAVLLQAAIDRTQQKASSAQVVILGSPAKRYGQLSATQQTYNAKHGSYINAAGLSRELRRRRSLNIPRETIELRNNMVANLKHNFTQDEQKVA